MQEQMEGAYLGFVRHMEGKGYLPDTQTSYAGNLVPFLNFLEEKDMGDLRAVDRELLKEYELRVAQEKNCRTGEPLSVNSRMSRIRSVKKFFGFLEGSGKVLVNPAVFLQEPKLPKKLPRNVLAEEQVERLVGAIDLATPVGVRDRAILEMFYSTGLRLAELAHLTLEDVNLVEGWVRVNQGKGRKDRVVPLGRQAAEFVKAYLTNVRPRFLLDKEPVSAVWLSFSGEPVGKQCVGLVVRKYARKAGIEGPVSAHILRHTFATHLVRNGAEIQAVSKMLGHTRLFMTQRYAQVAGAEVKETHQAAHPREMEGRAFFDARHTPSNTSACGLGVEVAG